MSSMTLNRFSALVAAVVHYEEHEHELMMVALGNGDTEAARAHALNVQYAMAGLVVVKKRFPKQASQLEGAVK